MLVAGLDLGQAADFTALAVLDAEPGPHPAREDARAWRFEVRHLQRWQLGTSYQTIVDDCAWLSAGRLHGAPWIVDATGVGTAVVDMLKGCGLKGQLVPVTITSGRHPTPDEKGGWNVPKKDLVAMMQAALQTGRLKIAAALPEAETLRKELAAFRVKITAAANETFGAWREGDHDDLVLAVGLACWWKGRFPCPVPEQPIGASGGGIDFPKSW